MKKLHYFFKNQSGRNTFGIKTVLTQSGGVKRKYRFIDFKRLINDFGFIIRIEKDPYRSAFIALICYSNGALSYIIATEKLKIGSIIYNTKDLINIGNRISVKDVSSGTLLNNLELYPMNGSILGRSAGTWIQIIKQFDKNFTQVKLRSGEQRLIKNNCTAIIGITSNIYHNQKKLIKAGQNRLLGFKPKVRGIAMNPVDHPNGGRTNGGTVWKTPWGKLSKFRKTVFKDNRFIIVKRRQNNKKNK